MTDIILLLGTGLGLFTLSMLMVHWDEVISEYKTWPDQVKTIVIVVGSFTLMGAAMHLLARI